MKFSFLLYSILILYLQSVSQLPEKLLKIGDTMPDINFKCIYNYHSKGARLSDFKSELIILDFWNLGCLPCIYGFPKLEKIKKEFGNRIQVLLVNNIDTKAVLLNSGFPENHKSSFIRETTLPFVMVADDFDELINPNTLPYHVWLDSNRKIVAMTTGKSTTSENIMKFLNGEMFKVRYQPTLSDMGLADGLGNVGNEYMSILNSKSSVVFPNILYSSIITKNISGKGFGSFLIDSSTGNFIGLRTYGSVVNLFRKTLTNSTVKNFPDRVVFEVANPSKYLQPLNSDNKGLEDWEVNNVYCYELRLPPNMMENLSSSQSKNLIKKIMREDLERFFGITVCIERRQVKCRILVQRGNPTYFTQNQNSYINERTLLGGLKLRNASFATLFSYLRKVFNSTSPMPILNETGIMWDKKIDFDITVAIYNLDEMRKQLIRYGLDFKIEERHLEVLVVKYVR